MQIVDINAAQPKLAALIHSAMAGEDVVISEKNGVMVRLTPFSFEKAPRVGGQWAGKIKMSDDFDECDNRDRRPILQFKIIP